MKENLELCRIAEQANVITKEISVGARCRFRGWKQPVCEKTGTCVFADVVGTIGDAKDVWNKDSIIWNLVMMISDPSEILCGVRENTGCLSHRFSLKGLFLLLMTNGKS